MFRMTKRQFLKKSKKYLNETGVLLLLIREVMDKEFQGKISNQEACNQMDNIRKNIESIFSEYEKSDPPSEYTSLKQKILRALINLQEAVVTNYESLLAAREGMEEKSRDKLNKSRNILEEFRKDFHPIAEEVDALLLKKQNRKIRK
ncbi:MAG: hypothetical protein QMD61_03730 [Methanobacterium sp.]|nr:hypothetical protein [Methanobacterium sp.]